MKKLVLTLALSAITSTAFAGGGKISILHCGVDEGGDVMRYVAISVSKSARGHTNHVIGSTDSVETKKLFTSTTSAQTRTAYWEVKAVWQTQ